MKKFLVLIGILFIVQICFAQEADLDLGKINILATRASLQVAEISQGMSVITQKDIERSTAKDLPSLIATQSGVFVTDYLGNPKGVRVDVRGFGETSVSNLLVLVDGRRTNQVDLSGVDWGQISLDSVERVEILKGAASVLYGDNAASGVVNIVTKKGYRPTQAPVRAAIEAGSFGYHKELFSAQGTTKKLDYYLDYTHQSTDGYRGNSDYWSNDILGNARAALTDTASIDVSSGYHRDHYGMPGALFAADITAQGRKASTHSEDQGLTSDVFVNVEPRNSFSWQGNDAELSGLLSFRKRLNHSLNVSSFGRYETNHTIHTLEARPKLLLESALGDLGKNTLTTGLDYFYAQDAVRSGLEGPGQDLVDITKETLGLYALSNAEVREHFLLTLGGRGTWADYDFDQTAAVVNREGKSIADGALSAGIGYKYRENSQVYFDYARSFRLPATDEYYQNKYAGLWGSGGGLNAELKHQMSHHYELGLRDLSLPGLRADTNVFLTDVRNEIYYDPITYKNSNYSPLTRHWGFELESKANLLAEALEPFINWTWQDAFFKGGVYAGKKVPFVPRNKISSGLSARFGQGLTAAFSANYVDKCFAISDLTNTQAKLNSYITFDLKADYQWKGAKVWFGVKNIFDRMYDAYGVYSSGAGEVGFYPAQGRSFYGGASLEF